MHEMISGCRSCGADGLRPVLALGETPLADRLIDDACLDQAEPRFPLTVAFCEQCSLVQLLETVPPELLFDADYPYFSSFSDTLLEHARTNVQALIASRGLGPDSLAVELASNEGYLLRHFVEAGIPVLGIDPAEGPARGAQAAGIPTLCRFFTRDLAVELHRAGHRPDVVIANNVLAHVPDLNGFVAGIAELLADDGVAVVEAPYVRDLVDHCEFDTIYHQHHCYFSVTALVALFARNGLTITEVEHHPIHGGSLRIFAAHNEPQASVLRDLVEEARVGVDTYAYCEHFAKRVLQVQRDLAALLTDLKRQGYRLASYGAAAKGATLLNTAGIGPDLLDFVVDRNVHKHGRYMPGVRLPIRDPAALLEEMPNAVLLLAWNFIDEVKAQQAEFLSRGGRFIVPVPQPQLVA